MRVIPNTMYPLYKNIAACFDIETLRRACRIWDAYDDNKTGFTTRFCPTHEHNSSLDSLKV